MASRVIFTCFLLISFFSTFISASGVPYSSFVTDSEGHNPEIFGVAINVPSNTTDDDLYFSLRGPAPCSWVAVGLGGKGGSQMEGSLIFVAYLAKNGVNVTVSPRLGLGHEQPLYTSEVKVEVMGDTHYEEGDLGGYFVDFRCTGCRSWNGGNSIDITSTEQPMIYALGQGGEILSDEQDAVIQQHAGGYGTFTLDLKNATGAAGLPSEADIESGSGSTGGGPNGRNFSTGFHALMMVGCFLVVLPTGYLALRVFERVWMHWAIQSFGLFIAILGTITGLVISHKDNISLVHPHQIIGLVALLLMFITWIAGLLGHLSFRRTKMSRVTIPQKSHRILGPGTVSIGLVNGVLGFQFADNIHAMIGYIVLTTLMIIFVSLIMMMKKRRSQRRNATMTPAAQNFRQGQTEGYVAPQHDEAAVPLQNYPTEYTGAGDPPPPAYAEAGGFYAPHGRPAA